MRALFDRLVIDNPMRIEIARFRRRFLGFGGNGLTSAVLSLIVLCYVGMVMLVINMRGDLPPVALIIFQTALFCFFGPMMLHGAIAGERERRSWDLLLVAPISKAQIVVGKFMGAMAALSLGAIAMALPIGIAAVAYHHTTGWTTDARGVTNISYLTTSYWNLALAEGVSLSFCTLVCALTIFLSSRAQRPFMALGTTIGVLAMGLLVVPALLLSLAGNDPLSMETFLYVNPFAALGVMIQNDPSQGISGERSMISGHLFGAPHILLYLALTVGFLIYAEKTLSFPDNDVKFMPKGHSNA